MRTTIWVAAMAAGMTLAAPAGAVVINFDTLSSSALVTNQFAEATFSANPGFAVFAFGSAATFGTSAPNFICTGPAGGGIDCVNDVNVAFTNPVNNLSFRALGDDGAGTQALVDVFGTSGLLATVNVVTDASPFVPNLVDLSAFANVTAITIRAVTDPAGLGYDDFTFDVSNSVATPEPASMALFGLGLLGLSAARRRR